MPSLKFEKALDEREFVKILTYKNPKTGEQTPVNSIKNTELLENIDKEYQQRKSSLNSAQEVALGSGLTLSISFIVAGKAHGKYKKLSTEYEEQYKTTSEQQDYGLWQQAETKADLAMDIGWGAGLGLMGIFTMVVALERFKGKVTAKLYTLRNATHHPNNNINRQINDALNPD